MQSCTYDWAATSTIPAMSSLALLRQACSLWRQWTTFIRGIPLEGPIIVTHKHTYTYSYSGQCDTVLTGADYADIVMDGEEDTSKARQALGHTLIGLGQLRTTDHLCTLLLKPAAIRVIHLRTRKLLHFTNLGFHSCEKNSWKLATPHENIPPL